ncbi:MAG: SGNH/GDSL hydrolase family protein [Phycisphaerales bacterium]
MQSLNLPSGPVTFAGAVGVDPIDGGFQPFRLRSGDRDLLHAELIGRAEMASGVRLTTITDSHTVELDLITHSDEPTAKVDVVIDGQLVRTLEYATNQRVTLCCDGLPGKRGRLELWLAMYGRTVVHGLRIDAGASAGRYDDRRLKWVTYGSSITMCRQAASPALTWPAIVSRRHELNLTSLGFGGQCHFDPIVGRTIASLPADRISLCLGINTHGDSFSQRTWTAAVIGLILTVRDGHGDTPMAIISPICSPPREHSPGATGMTLTWMRDELRQIVTHFRARGDKHLHYIDGLSIMGESDVRHMPDELHPDAEGYQVMAERMSEALFAPGRPLA